MTVKQFRDTELTNTGFSVSNKAALGKTQYSTTRAVTTDVDLSSYKVDDLKNLTSLPNEINSGIITDYDMPGNNVSAIKINFNNSNFKDGYVVRAVGMYAKESGSDKEFLHSITVSDSPVYIPAVSGNVFDGFYLTMAIFTGNNKNINIKIADETNATVKYVDDAVSKVANVANNATPSDAFNKYVVSNNNVIDRLRVKDNDLQGQINNSLKFVRNLTSDDDLNKFITSDYYSIYELNGQIPKNAPADLKNPYGVVVMIGNFQQTQYIITDSVYFRTATNTWKNDWKTLATTDAINQINSSISVLSQAISDASTIASKANGLASQAQATAYNGLQYRGFWTGRKYWDWNGQPDGIYSIDINQQPRDGMIPREFTGWGILILITNISNQDRYCTLQDNNNHMFRNHQFVGSGGFSGWIQY